MGCGSGTSRSLFPLPMMCSTARARSTALISRVVASPMRRPHEYTVARQVRWIGLRMPLSRRRICSSESASGSRFCRGEEILFPPEQSPDAAQRVAVEELQSVSSDLERAARHAALAQG